MPIRTTTRPAAIALLGAALATGCSTSNDKFVYESTAYRPVSLELIDVRSNEVFWTVDVPVGQKLVVQFFKDKSELAEATTPDLMRWELYDRLATSVTMRNAMAVPPADVRRMDMTLRPTPEYPPENDPFAGVAIVRTGDSAPMPARATSSSGRAGTYYRQGQGEARATVMPDGTEGAEGRMGVYYNRP